MTTSLPTSPPPNSIAESSSLAGSPTTIPPTKRRWWLPRLSLRTTLLVMLVLGAGFGIGGNFWRKVHRQRRLVSILEGAGGHVQYGYEFGSGIEVDYEFSVDGHKRGAFYATPPMVKVNDPTSKYQRFGTPPGPRIVRSLFGENVYATIEGVSFFGYEPAKKLDLDLLDELPELRQLRLSGIQVNDETVRAVANLPRLRALELSGKQAGASGDAVRALRQARRLEGLALSGDWVTDNTLQAVSELTQLKYLILTDAPNVTPDGLESIGQLRQLQHLRFVKTPQIDDDSLRHLVDLEGLKSLLLMGTANVDFNLEQLSRLQNLQELELGNTVKTRPSLKFLGSVPGLRRLSLRYTSLEDHDLEYLTRMTQLRELRIDSSEFTNEGLVTPATMNQLQLLDIRSGKATDEGFRQLKALTNLRVLQVSGNIQEMTVQELHSALPDCWMQVTNAQGTTTQLQP